MMNGIPDRPKSIYFSIYIFGPFQNIASLRSLSLDIPSDGWHVEKAELREIFFRRMASFFCTVGSPGR